MFFKESISAEEIQKEVARVAQEINADYVGKEPLFVCVLNGAFMYAADLLKHITLPCEITFVRMKSYEGTETTGKVNMLIPLQVDVKGRDVIVIEDIIDTGRTLAHLKQNLLYRGAKEVKICTFLNKPSRRVVDVDVDYCGFVIPDEFVVGYGLDYAEKYRNLDYIGVLDTNYL